MIRINKFIEFKKICLYRSGRNKYCDHVGNAGAKAHKEFKKECLEKYCPYRDNFKESD